MNFWLASEEFQVDLRELMAWMDKAAAFAAIRESRSMVVTPSSTP
jgi:hypothetical protein